MKNESIFKPSNQNIKVNPDRPLSGIDRERRRASAALWIAGIFCFLSSFLAGLLAFMTYTVVGATTLSAGSSHPPVGFFVFLGIALAAATFIGLGVMALFQDRFRAAFSLALVAGGVAALPLLFGFVGVVVLFLM